MTTIQRALPLVAIFMATCLFAENSNRNDSLLSVLKTTHLTRPSRNLRDTSSLESDNKSGDYINDIDNVNNTGRIDEKTINMNGTKVIEPKANDKNKITIIHESECMYRSTDRIQCKISAVDPYMNAKVTQMVEKERITLIEYSFYFSNYTPNPFLFNATYFHKPHIWSRTSTTYGQTLLSLAFNYGILSLMTLTFGTTKSSVELTDNPVGCFGDLPEMDKMAIVRELVMHDFASIDLNEIKENKTSNFEVVRNGARICHEVVENDNGYAKFTDCCCYANVYSGEKVCSNSSENTWLTFLYTLLSGVRYCIFFFGPLLFLSTMTGLARDEFPYTVKLNDKLEKIVYFCRTDQDVPENLKYDHVLDFRNKQGFPKFKDALNSANTEIDEFWNNKENGSFKESQSEMVEEKNSDVDPKENEESGSKEKFGSKNKLETNDVFELPKCLFKCPVRINIKEYDILINYKRLVTENDVSIGFWKTISNMVFMCRLRNVGPFQDCCRENMFKNALCLRNRPVSWFSFWKIVGSILLVVLLPLPYYLRLWVLYRFEIDEITSRKQLISTLGLTERFENSLLHYFLPNHILFLFIYFVYALLAVCFVAMPDSSEDGKTKRVVINSFTDLKNLSWVDVLHMLVSNIIWPFKKFGVLGFLVAIIYWPVVIPASLFVFGMYCLPTLFLTARMIYYAKKVFKEKRIKRTPRAYRVNRKTDNNLRNFYVENMSKKCFEDESDVVNELNNNEDDVDNRNEYNKTKLMKQSSKMSDVIDIDEVDHLNPSRLTKFRTRSASLASTVIKFNDGNRICHFLGQILVSFACVVVLYSILIIVTECLGSLVDMLVFTMMGIIVNAGNLLKYIALIIMIVVYSYDSFNNVEKKYLKLNKALFTEVKSRIKDLDKVTSLPSYLQENRGFKSQENNEQAEYEIPDNVSERLPRHWFINDLVLFVDNEDMPRIPKKLFENVCEIKVAGVPGPVYRGLLLALKQFFKIVTFIVFVFIVVLTFGSVYEVSNTNQMLAALAGGSLPFILRTFMEPEKPEIEMGTVSFKSKLDEVIKNFAQVWPMYDFDFELYKPEEEDDLDSENEDKKKGKKERKDSLTLAKKCLNSMQIRKASVPLITSTEQGRNFLLYYSSDNLFSEYITDNRNTTPVTNQTHVPNHRTVGPTKSNQSAKVCFLEPEKENTESVDIVILLPEEFSDIFDDPLVSSKV